MNTLFVKQSPGPLSSKATRNCFGCGKTFQSVGSGICSDCRVTKARKTAPPHPPLSLREGQIVGLVCKAMLNKEIAFELHLTEGTIKEYLHRIFKKLGVSNRTELAVWALTRGNQGAEEYVA